MGELSERVAELEAIYDRVPAMDCRHCGTCCVSPMVTLIEYTCVLGGMLATFDREDWAEWLETPPEPTRPYDGNILCHLRNDTAARCQIYPYRPLGCRLEGFPVMDELCAREEPQCPHCSETNPSNQPTTEEIDRLIQDVYALSEPLHPFLEEPYFLDALNIPCWFAVLLDPRIDQPLFVSLRKRLGREFEIEFLQPLYRDHTRFADKLRCIETFFERAGRQDTTGASTALQRALYDFPRTGCYFYHQGSQFLELIGNLSVQQEGRN